eukprot:sb/3468891/
MSETEKSDKKYMDKSINFGALGFVALCFFHVYNFFLILAVGMATDTLISTTGKAALYEVLWIMISSGWCWKMVLVGLIGMFTTISVMCSAVNKPDDKVQTAKAFRVITMVTGFIFLMVYFEDTVGQWADCDKAQTDCEEQYESCNIPLINSYRARAVFSGIAAAIYLISILLAVPLLFTMSGITPFPEDKIPKDDVPADDEVPETADGTVLGTAAGGTVAPSYNELLAGVDVVLQNPATNPAFDC